MLDKDFLEFLEYKICHILENTGIDEVNGFWCDGVMLSKPDSYYSPEYINDNREVMLTALTGKEGQTRFELTLKFGNKSLSRYVRNLDIKDCWPEGDQEDWFDIDIKSSQMIIQLD